MTWNVPLVCLALVLPALSGCSMSPEQQAAREDSLKQSIDSLIHEAAQSNWDNVLALSEGAFETPDQVRENILKSGVPDATLIGGDIASMSWVNDRTAKVKVTWVFQSQGVQSFSSETLIWAWNGNNWKYKGLALR